MSNKHGVNIDMLARHLDGHSVDPQQAQTFFNSVGALSKEGKIRAVFSPHLEALVRAIDNLQYGNNKVKLSYKVEDGWSLGTLQSELQNNNSDAQLVAARLLKQIVANRKTIGVFIQSIGAPKAAAPAPAESPADAPSGGVSDLAMETP